MPTLPSSENSESSPQTTPPKSFKQTPYWRGLKIFGSWALALLIALTIQRYGFQSYQVFGQSMEPTLSQGNYLIISKLHATFAKLRHRDYVPARGSIVVLNSPKSDIRLIKRVIGLPGERITVSNGDVKIYNAEHPEGFDPYQALGLPDRFTDGQLTTEVPLGHIFVIGDNRQVGGSADSRNELGPVPTDHIIGTLSWRLWPFSQPKQ